jgi:hypothetical protein
VRSRYEHPQYLRHSLLLTAHKSNNHAHIETVLQFCSSAIELSRFSPVTFTLTLASSLHFWKFHFSNTKRQISHFRFSFSLQYPKSASTQGHLQVNMPSINDSRWASKDVNGTSTSAPVSARSKQPGGIDRSVLRDFCLEPVSDQG